VLHEYGQMLQHPTIAAAAPATKSRSSERATLTVIESASRRVFAVYDVDDHWKALAIFRGWGEGYDAHIRTAKYSELRLSISRDNQSLD
jgi:hypothetical protein